MRTATGIAIGAASLGAAAAAVGRLWRDRASRRPVRAAFPNGMTYARFGAGSRTLLWIPDPGHAGHGGPYLWMMARVVRPLVDAGYSVFLVGRAPHLQPGCTLADLGDDYARLITDEFDGRVEVIVGDSGGGMIAFTVAARHAERFGRIAVVAAGRVLSDETRNATVESARLLAAGRRTDAAEAMASIAFPQVTIGWARRLLAVVIGRVSFPSTVDPGDLLAGAEALAAFDGQELLPTVNVPLLLVGGDHDAYVPEDVYLDTAALIPRCTLKIYPGKDHLGTIGDPRLAQDILNFVAEAP